MMGVICVMMMGVIYNDDESDDDLCACFRVVHFRESLGLICGLCDYVYMCNTCRI